MRIMISPTLERAIASARIDGRGVPAHVTQMPDDMFGQREEDQARRNHGQTLTRLAQRGGLDAIEALAVLSCMPLNGLALLPDENTAHRILYAMRGQFRRGKLIATEHLKSAIDEAHESVSTSSSAAGTEA